MKMLNRFGVALGAGLASALLFLVTIQGTAIAMALAYLAPLPIMIATLGWGVEIGAIALGVACTVVAGALAPVSGPRASVQSALLFAATVAAPGWALSALAALRSLPALRRSADPAPPVRAGVGLLVVAAGAIGIAISLGALALMIAVYGGYSAGVQAVADLLRPALEEAVGGSLGLPDDFSLDDFVRLVVKFSPAAIAASTTLMFTVNLYAAARSTQMSQRLNRPWPDVPSSLIVPPALGGLAVATLVVWLVAPEPVSEFAAVFVGGLGVVYLLQGLAVLHALSRRAPGRPALIGALYLACLVAPRWVLPAIAAIGLIESVASLRARAAARPSRT